MAENKEQLKIEAQFDASKLKQKSKQALNDIQRETQKLGAEAKKTSEAFNTIGNSASRSLDNVSKSARKATDEVKRLNETTKKIGLQQGLGMASQLVSQHSSAITKGLTNAGMSQDSAEQTSSALAGGLKGAAMGAAAGPWGAVIGALGGAALGLTQAADEQKKAAASLANANRGRYEALVKQDGENQKSRAFQRRVQGYTEGLSGDNAEATVAKLKQEIINRQSELGGLANRRLGIQSDTSIRIQAADQNIKDYKDRQKRVAQIYEEQANELEDIMTEENRQNTELNILTKLLETYAKSLTKATESTEKVTPVNEKVAEIKPDADSMKYVDSLVSDYDKIGSGFKLSDSLTNVGGGAGYTSQMMGVTSNVTKIRSVLEQIRDKIQTGNSTFNENGMTEF